MAQSWSLIDEQFIYSSVWVFRIFLSALVTFLSEDWVCSAVWLDMYIYYLYLYILYLLFLRYYGLWMWFPELFSRMKDGGSPCDQSNSNFINQTSKNETTCNYKDNWVYFSGFMTALSNLPGNILTIFLMDRIGRKQLLGKKNIPDIL